MREEDGSPCISIARQIRGYKDSDPSIKHQACLPLSIFQAIFKSKSSHFNISIGQLISGALFFACRSCEYCNIESSEPRKTKPLRLQNLRFTKDKRVLTSGFEDADSVTITFHFQKNGERGYTITQHKSGSTLCPVRAWGLLKTRILSYKGTSESTKVNVVRQKGRLLEITSKQVKAHLVLFSKIMGASQLGIDTSRIGTHSIRTSCAMLLHLAGVQVYIIMMIGRWKSDAFLVYLRTQVEEFTSGIAKSMVTSATGQSFFTAPSTLQRDNWDPCLPQGSSRLSAQSHPHGSNRQYSSIDRHHPPAFQLWK